MSSKYFEVRTPCDIEVKGKKHTFHIREMGYLEFEDFRKASLRNGESDKERAGIGLIDSVVLATVQEEDGSASYTEEEWRSEIRDVVLQLGKAALKVQGIDVDAASDPQTAEEAEGNA